MAKKGPDSIDDDKVRREVMGDPECLSRVLNLASDYYFSHTHNDAVMHFLSQYRLTLDDLLNSMKRRVIDTDKTSFQNRLKLSLEQLLCANHSNGTGSPIQRLSNHGIQTVADLEWLSHELLRKKSGIKNAAFTLLLDELRKVEIDYTEDGRLVDLSTPRGIS